jgi:hypothetical protein
MKIRPLLVIVLGLVFLAGCQSWRKDVSDWEKLSDAEGKFSITMPPHSEVKNGTKMDVPPGAKSTTVNTHYHVVSDKHRAYTVGWFDYPPDATYELKISAEGCLQAPEIDGTIISEEQVTLKDSPQFPAIEFTANVKQPKAYTAVGRVIQVKNENMNRGYFLLAAGDGFAKSDKAVRTFLDTFTLNLTDSAGSTGGEGSGSLNQSTIPTADWTVTDLDMDTKGLLPCMVWAGDYNHFFVINKDDGTLKYVSLVKGEPVRSASLEEPVVWMSGSAEGLVISSESKKEVVLVNPGTMTVINRYPVNYLKRAVGGARSSLALLSIPSTLGKPTLGLLDLKTGQSVPVGNTSNDQAGYYYGPFVSPDGTYLFSQSKAGVLYRSKFTPGFSVTKELESKPLRTTNVIADLCLSPDARYICLPCDRGNTRDITNPPVPDNTTFIFSTTDLVKPVCFIEHGAAAPEYVAFDTAAKLIYTNNNASQLLVYDFNGKRWRAYSLGPRGGTVRGYLVHPSGRKLVIMTQNSMYWAELPAAF